MSSNGLDGSPIDFERLAHFLIHGDSWDANCARASLADHGVDVPRFVED